MQQSTTPLLIGEFKITVGGKWTKLLSYIALACLSIYIGWLIIVSESGLVAKYIAFLFFSAIACVFVFKVIDAFFHKLIIRQQSLILKKWVSNDIIYFKDIAGYRIEHDAFYIVHTDSTREPIRIPRNLERSD